MHSPRRANHPGSIQTAGGNSTSLGRKWTCLESQAGALNQRSSEDAKVRILVSKNLNRRRRRGLGRSKKIPDISRQYGSLRARLQVRIQTQPQPDHSADRRTQSSRNE